jgi:hypothetical protein
MINKTCWGRDEHLWISISDLIGTRMNNMAISHIQMFSDVEMQNYGERTFVYRFFHLSRKAAAGNKKRMSL